MCLPRNCLGKVKLINHSSPLERPPEVHVHNEANLYLHDVPLSNFARGNLISSYIDDIPTCINCTSPFTRGHLEVLLLGPVISF